MRAKLATEDDIFERKQIFTVILVFSNAYADKFCKPSASATFGG